MNAQERAMQINKEASGDVFQIGEDSEHWALYGITTGEELVVYLAWEEWSWAHKSIRGFRSRIQPHWRDLTAQEWADLTTRLRAQAQREAVAKKIHDRLQLRVWKSCPVPLSHTNLFPTLRVSQGWVRT